MSASPSVAVRAPRLTDQRLADLVLVVNALEGEIKYLEEAFPAYPPGHSLHVKLKARFEALARGRDWIAGKVEAERNHREHQAAPAAEAMAVAP